MPSLLGRLLGTEKIKERIQFLKKEKDSLEGRIEKEVLELLKRHFPEEDSSIVETNHHELVEEIKKDLFNYYQKSYDEKIFKLENMLI